MATATPDGVYRVAGKTREYLRTYEEVARGGEKATHVLVEKLRRTFKCHRSSLDFGYKFIRDA